MFKRRQLLRGCGVPVVSRQPACYSIGWRWFARCGRMNGERTELTQGFVKSSCHLTNCMLVDDQPWHRFHSFLYYSVLDSPVAGWKDAQVQFFYTASRLRAYAARRRHPNTMATKTGASHFHIGLLGSLFEQGLFFFFFLHEGSRWCWDQSLVPEKTAILLRTVST